jgi:hypothetical protein
VIPFNELPDEIALAACGIEIIEEYKVNGEKTLLSRRVKPKFPDKNKVRDSLARLLGLTNGNADMVKEVLKEVLGIQVNVNIGDSAIEKDRPEIIELVKGLSAGKLKEINSNLPPVGEAD